MSTTAPGLAALQQLIPTIQSFATQQSTDLATMGTTIATAITSLQGSAASEDPAVLTAVTTLQGLVTTMQSNQAALEALNSQLATAETPAAAAAAVAAVSK